MVWVSFKSDLWPIFGFRMCMEHLIHLENFWSVQECHVMCTSSFLLYMYLTLEHDIDKLILGFASTFLLTFYNSVLCSASKILLNRYVILRYIYERTIYMSQIDCRISYFTKSLVLQNRSVLHSLWVTFSWVVVAQILNTTTHIYM